MPIKRITDADRLTSSICSLLSLCGGTHSLTSHQPLLLLSIHLHLPLIYLFNCSLSLSLSPLHHVSCFYLTSVPLLVFFFIS